MTEPRNDSELDRLFRRRTCLKREEVVDFLHMKAARSPQLGGAQPRERPATEMPVSARSLLSDQSARARATSLLRNDWVPGVIEDRNFELLEMSKSYFDFTMRSGSPASDQFLLMPLKQQVEVLGVPELWDMFVDSGVMSGSVQMVRFAMNIRGRGHIAHYEPIFEQGEISAFFAYPVRDFALPKNEEISVELFEVVPRSTPQQVRSIFEGERSKYVGSSFVVSSEGQSSSNRYHNYKDAKTVRLAKAFIHENFDNPLTVFDIADAVGVGIRQLNRAFQRSVSISPISYLRMVRLETTRAFLTRGEPGMTVTTVAHDCGFSHIGRFAQYYFEAYGETPSQTLNANRARGT